MNERTLRILEFDKIKNKIMNLASSELGKEMAEDLKPEKDFQTVSSLLKETDDGVAYLVRKGSPPLGGIHDIRGSLKRVEVGSIQVNRMIDNGIEGLFALGTNGEFYALTTDEKLEVGFMLSSFVPLRKIGIAAISTSKIRKKYTEPNPPIIILLEPDTATPTVLLLSRVLSARWKTCSCGAIK